MLLAMQPLPQAYTPAPSSSPSGSVDSNKHPAADGPCFIYMQQRYSRVKHCRYRANPADLAAPAAESIDDDHYSSTSSAITKQATERTGGNRNGLDGQCDGSDDPCSGSALRVGNVGTDRPLRKNVAWRGSRGGGGSRGGARGDGGSSGGGGTARASSSG